MYACQDATLNLSPLLNNSLNNNEIVGMGLLTPVLDFSSEVIFQKPLNWKITVLATSGDGGFVFTGSVKGEVLMPCRRCLEPVSVFSNSELIYKMLYLPNVSQLELIEEYKDEEHLVFGTPEVDFSELLIQVFLVDLPITALCQEDCQGIVVEGMKAKELDALTDSPFAVLRDLHIN